MFFILVFLYFYLTYSIKTIATAITSIERNPLQVTYGSEQVQNLGESNTKNIVKLYFCSYVQFLWNKIKF